MSDDVTGFGGANPPMPDAQPGAQVGTPIPPAGTFLPEGAAPFAPTAPAAAAVTPEGAAPYDAFTPPAGAVTPEDVATYDAPPPAVAPEGVATYDAPPPAVSPEGVAPHDALAPPASTADGQAWSSYAAPLGTGVETGAPVGLTDLEVLPASHAAPETRRPARTAVIATLSVLALLLVGGGAYGWTLLHRPDVQLARAFDATKSQPAGGMTVSMRVAGAGSDASAQMLKDSSIRYAWGPNTQQFVVTVQGKPTADVVTTPTHLTLQVALAGLPGTAAAVRQLHTMATTMGDQGQALADLADGKPIGLAIGPGSDFQKLLDKAKAQQGSAASQAVNDQAASIADSISKVVRDNTTVTESGSDANGDHYVASIPLSPLMTALQGELAKLYPGMSPLSNKDLASVQGKVLTADVWVRDGQVSRLEIPLAALADAPKGAEATVVVVMDGNGVTPPAGPVTEVPSSLFQSLLDPVSG